MIRILTITCLAAFCLSAHAQTQQLTESDIWSSSRLHAKKVSGFRTMNDGLHYTNTTQEDDILVYEYKSGTVKDTLLRAAELLDGNGDNFRYDDYQLSRSETKVLISTATERIYRHSTRADFYVFNRSNGKLTRVSDKGKQMFASFSPDGFKVAFVRDNNLFIKDLVKSRETQVTFDGRLNEIINGGTDWVYEEEFSFDQAYAWSPDSRRIAFYKFNETRVREFTIPYYDQPYVDQKTYKYPKAGEDNAIVHIHVYDLSSGRTVKMETGPERDQYIPRIRWTADPGKLCVMRLNRHQNKLELLLCDAQIGGSRVFYTEETKYYIEIDQNDGMHFTADQKSFFWLKPVNGYTHLVQIGMDGKHIRQWTGGDWDVTAFYGYDEGGNAVYFQSAEKSPLERHIYRIDSKGRKTALTKTGGTHDAEFSANFRYFIDTWSDTDSPYRCTIRASEDGGEIRLLEDNNPVKDEMRAYDLSTTEFFSFMTSGGDELHGWMIKPPDFDPSKKYPVLQYMYGGPGSQTVRRRWGGANYFYWQMLARKGCIVVSVDNRGTGARGEAFQKCTFLNLGKLEVDDQVEAAGYLATLPYIDKNRMAVFGWSYGGYMTSLLMTRTAGTFRAGIAVAPVTSWRFYDTIYTERYLHTPAENAAGYDDNSPINYADRLEGSFLLVHGLYDDNVHFQNSALFVNALVKAGKHFETFFYPNKNHALPGVRLHLYRRITRFLGENLEI